MRHCPDTFTLVFCSPHQPSSWSRHVWQGCRRKKAQPSSGWVEQRCHQGHVSSVPLFRFLNARSHPTRTTAAMFPSIGKQPRSRSRCSNHSGLLTRKVYGELATIPRSACASTHTSASLRQCIKLEQHFDFKGHTCLVTELLSSSVFDFLKENSYNAFPYSHVQSFAKQLFTSINCTSPLVSLRCS